jgi:hypothetical protein
MFFFLATTTAMSTTQILDDDVVLRLTFMQYTTLVVLKVRIGKK